MINFIVGVIVGIVIATVGFSGIAKMADKGVDKVKEVTIEQVK
jgi:uncharacterized membrane-anchored protein YhcB (DUF1043 family)